MEISEPHDVYMLAKFGKNKGNCKGDKSTYNTPALREIRYGRHTADIWQIYGGHMANIRRTYSEYTANGQPTYGKHTADIQRTCGDHTAKIQQKYSKHTANIRQKMLRTYSEHTLKTSTAKQLTFNFIFIIIAIKS